jgi:hypothetical protein
MRSDHFLFFFLLGMAPTIPGARQLVNPRPGLITIWYIHRVILANLQDVITMRERQRKEINKD